MILLCQRIPTYIKLSHLLCKSFNAIPTQLRGHFTLASQCNTCITLGELNTFVAVCKYLNSTSSATIRFAGLLQYWKYILLQSNYISVLYLQKYWVCNTHRLSKVATLILVHIDVKNRPYILKRIYGLTNVENCILLL